ncbi:hypothetical protein [Roseateles chitosanitabidus]|jgi:hypothetical protein|uniref:hypothetical protein n=1 Tax=Roseateles chitosanitabidus TaxID=65048 RepID=UPI000833A53E|nr:hypothetical protein [Roseateles chitosanitabidus]MBO9688297.1 hypothetical protein [Roseateles chitosanitabidus]
MAEQISEIVSVAPVRGALFLLFVDYEEGDAGNGTGQVYRTDASRAPDLVPILNSNDALRRLWASPSGALWVASENGHVHTSAAVNWPAPNQPGLDIESLLPGMPFTSTTLPPPREAGGRPTLGTLWGTADDDVHVAASGGLIYHWDGRSWRIAFAAAGEIRAFGGTGPTDVYAVGERGTLLHFDGRAWSPVAAPEGVSPSDTFTGCCATGDGSVLVSSMGGRVLQGTRSGWVVLGQDDRRQFLDVGVIGGRILLAARDQGCVELTPDGFVELKSNFHASEIIPNAGVAYFLGASPVTAYIEYDPGNDELPWARISF